MSSSSATPQRHTGRVFLGVDTPGPDQMSIQELEGKKKLTWDGAMDEEFISRVRGKAQVMAKDIIAKAMLEAEDIHERARQEGFAQGIAQGDEMLRAQLEETALGLSQVLETIRAQTEEIWAVRRADMLQLIHVAVEKIVAVEIDERRAEILEQLLEEALDRLESDRFLTVRCAAEDAPVLEELLKKAQTTNPKLDKWLIKPDPRISAGVVLEAVNAKVENGVDGRWEGVREILDQLTLRRLGEKKSEGGDGA